MEYFCEIILNLDQLFSRCCFKNVSYLQFWRSSCWVERNNLDNFGKGHYEEYFCEIILKLVMCFRRTIFF